MKKIDKILQYIDSQEIDIAKFERESGISNGYFANTQKRKSDITEKILDKIRQNQPKIYYAVFNTKPQQEPQPKQLNTPTMETDYRDKYEQLLEKTNAEQSAIITGMFSILNKMDANITAIKTNLSDAAYNQQIFRVMTNERQRVMLENVAALRGLNKNELVNEADNTAAARLDEYERTHTVSSDTVGK